MNYRLKKVAVLGSGIMGSGIACHLANVGMEVVMLDIVTPDLNDEKSKSTVERNKLVNSALQKTIKSKPAPLYHKSFASRIKTGNFEDDFQKIAESDWIIEVVVENLKIKKQIFEKVDKYRKKGSLVSSNTSSIPINLLAQDRSDDFKKSFCGTHFFNPARYLRLLEIIPTNDTLEGVTDFFMEFGKVILGKQTVLCKDTPAFIGNRDDKTMASINQTMEGNPSARDYYLAAVYFKESGRNLQKAKRWIAKAIEIDGGKYWMFRQQALILAKLDEKEDAIIASKNSLELAKQAGNQDYIRLNNISIAEWSK